MHILHDKNAILTGGSRGLGVYIARALIAEGVHLALVAHSVGLLRAVAQELAQPGVKVIPIVADIADFDQRERLFQIAHAALGPIDILVNNAAIEETARFDRQAAETIRQTIETNLTHAMQLSRSQIHKLWKTGIWYRSHNNWMKITAQ